MKSSFVPAVLGMITLVASSSLMAADALTVACSAAGSKAAFRMDAEGRGSLEAESAGNAYVCDLQLKVLEGPPFSQGMTDMLVLTFERQACKSALARRRLMKEFSLHITDPQGLNQTGMTVIERRPVLLDCKVAVFDLEAVRQLAAPNGPVTISSRK
jgi:hypothetical protein